MTTATDSVPRITPPPAGLRSAAKRAYALSRAEVRLLVRNRTAVFTVLAMPLGFVVLLLMTTAGVAEDGMALGSFIAMSLIGFVLLFVVYYNLVTTLVARREELVLKRLRTGEATDSEILVGTAVPSLLVAVAQVVIVGVAVSALLGRGMPVNPILVSIAFVAGTGIFVLLAIASTAFTRTTEMAQLTTLPIVLVSMLMSGMTIPIDVFPDMVASIARVMPLTPVVQLTQLGIEGRIGTTAAPVAFADTFGAAIVPLIVLAVWLYVGVYATRRWFRWEPRA